MILSRKSTLALFVLVLGWILPESADAIGMTEEGSIDVPLRHAQRSGPRLTLPYIHIRSASGDLPAVIILTGGPGASARELVDIDRFPADIGGLAHPPRCDLA